MKNILIKLFIISLFVSTGGYAQKLCIPFYLTPDRNDIVLKGYEIKGEKLNFLYDSGNTVNALSRSAAERLGFIFDGDTTKVKTLGGRVFTSYSISNYYIDPFLSFFGEAMSDNSMKEIAGEGIDGIVGYTQALEKYMLELDFENLRLCFWDSIPDFYTTDARVKSAPLVPPDYGAETEYSKYIAMNSFSIKGTVTIADSVINTTFILDTGCSGYLLYHFFDNSLFAKAVDYKKEMSAKYGDSYPTTKLTIPELGIDSLMTSTSSLQTFNENDLYRLSFGSKPMGCYLGVAFFRQYKKILFDWKNKMAYFFKEN
jgi:hypothetical protein